MKGEERDYSSNLIVFPGKRPAHFLRKAMAKKIEGSFIPPVLFSMDEFIDSVYESKEPTASVKLDPIDAVSILYRLQLKASKPIGGEHFMTPDRFFPIGVKIYRDLEELLIEGIPVNRVQEIETLVQDAVPGPSRERLQSLSYFYEEFYSSLRVQGFSTRSTRYKTVSETVGEGDLSRFAQVIFAGFFALTGSEKVLFRKMLSMEKAVLLFQDGTGIREIVSDLGATFGEKEEEERFPEIQFYKSPDTHGQIFALSRILQQDLEEKGPPDEKTVIVLPSSETLFPVLHHVLSRFEEKDYNISLGYPLSRTPVYGFFNNLMELVTSMDGNRVYVPAYLGFILHPYTKNIYFKGSSEITRILFHTLEEELTRARSKKFLALIEMEEDGEFFKKVMEKLGPAEKGVNEELLKEHMRLIHQNTVGKFLSFRDVRDFAVKSIEVLTFLFDHSTGRLHPLFHPLAEAFLRAFETISKSLMREIRFSETRSYFFLLKKYLASCYVPFEGTPLRGLQVLGVLETRSLSFERVFVLDVNEGLIPESGGEDSLLPFKVRKVLGLPTYIDRDRLSAYYFETLWRGAKEVHLFSVENDQKETSRFMEQLLWLRQKKESERDPKRYVQSVQYRVSLENKVPGEIRKTKEIVNFLKTFVYSPTALDSYLKCQLLFYYRYVLGIEKKEEITETLERMDIGKFVHGVLSVYFGKRRGVVLKEQDISLKEMSSLIDARFEMEYGEDPVGSAYLLKRQIKDHLEDFLKYYTLPLIREVPVTVLQVEESVRAERNGFRLKGRLDHIEKRDEKIVIIDYKTSSDPSYLRIRFDKLEPERRETWDEAIGSLQLPLYLLLYSDASGKKVEELDGMFLLLGRKALNREIEHSLFADLEDPVKKFEQVKTVIFSLLNEITDPEQSFRPSLDVKGQCPSCDFKNLCGTQWVI